MLELRREKDCIYLSGRFDASQVEKARTVFDEIEKTCTANFSDLRYISSAGLGILLMTQKRLQSKGYELKIAGLNSHIREIFRYAGFDMIFTIIE